MDSIDLFQVVDEVNDNPELDLTLEDALELGGTLENEIGDNLEVGELDKVEEIEQEGEECQVEDGAAEQQNDIDKKTTEDNTCLDEDQEANEVLQEIENDILNDQKPEVEESTELPDENNGTHESKDEAETTLEEEKDEKIAEPPHPYLYLVESFEFQKEQLSVTDEQSVKNHSEATFLEIRSKVAMIKMLDTLRNAKEIGLDLQIPTHKYWETVCLIQISTGEKYYLLDAIKLKNDLLMLTEIFINPKIVKVVFRPKTVLPILQNKLRLFIINLFGIEEARIALNEPPRSLNSILRHEFTVERGELIKPDYRKRPIPPEYKEFLMGGVHYLINLYHVYKNRLIEKDLEEYKQFLEKCREACKVTYSGYKETIYNLYEHEVRQRHKCELEVLKKLFNWRSKVAKKLNLDSDIVLHKTGLLNIVKNLPTTDHEIMNYAHSTHAKKDINEIKATIVECKSTFGIVQKKKYKPPQEGTQQPRKVGPKPNLNQTKEVQFKTRTQNVYQEFLNNLANQNEKNELRNRPHVRSRKRGAKNVQQNNSPPTKKGKIKPWLPQPENRAYSDESGPVFLSTTNVPSTFTFQSPQNSGPSRNNYGRDTQDLMEMPMKNFGQTQRNVWRPNQNAYRNNSFEDFQNSRQDEDDFSFSTNSNSSRQGFNRVDKRINNFERKFQDNPQRNRPKNFKNRNSDDSFYKRRY